MNTHDVALNTKKVFKQPKFDPENLQPNGQQFGSSPNSEKAGPDLEEEVGVFAEAVGHPLDHLDLVVDAFDQVGTEPTPAVGEDAGQVRPQVPGEPAQRLDAAAQRLAVPTAPGPGGMGRVAVAP